MPSKRFILDGGHCSLCPTSRGDWISNFLASSDALLQTIYNSWTLCPDHLGLLLKGVFIKFSILNPMLHEITNDPKVTSIDNKVRPRSPTALFSIFVTLSCG